MTGTESGRLLGKKRGRTELDDLLATFAGSWGRLSTALVQALEGRTSLLIAWHGAAALLLVGEVPELAVAIAAVGWRCLEACIQVVWDCQSSSGVRLARRCLQSCQSSFDRRKLER